MMYQNRIKTALSVNDDKRIKTINYIEMYVNSRTKDIMYKNDKTNYKNIIR